MHAMKKAIVIELQRDSIFRLAELRGAMLSCLSGAVWITRANDPRDLILQAGETHMLSGRAVLVQAVRASRITVEALSTARTVACASYSPAA